MNNDPDPDNYPSNPRTEDDDLDFSTGGKLPPDHPDADIIDDLDL